MAIDVGGTADDKSTDFESGENGSTIIEGSNPANATGLIFSISIYCVDVLESVQVAAFEEVSTDRFTTRGSSGILANTSPGLNTYNAPASFEPFEIRMGDYIGIYYASTVNGIDMETSGTNIWWFEPDLIPCTNQLFNKVADREIALSATGYELGKINIGDSWKTIQNIQINVGDDWKQLCDLQINISDVWKNTLM